MRKSSNKLVKAPITIVTGVNGVGKTTLCSELGLVPIDLGSIRQSDIMGFLGRLWDGVPRPAYWLEHPEAHLHPCRIVELADKLVEVRRKDRVLYIETHSEVLLRQLYRHIEVGRLGSEDIAFNDVQEGGKIIVTPLQDCWVSFTDVWPNAMIVARTYGS